MRRRAPPHGGARGRSPSAPHAATPEPTRSPPARAVGCVATRARRRSTRFLKVRWSDGDARNRMRFIAWEWWPGAESSHRYADFQYGHGGHDHWVAIPRRLLPRHAAKAHAAAYFSQISENLDSSVTGFHRGSIRSMATDSGVGKRGKYSRFPTGLLSKNSISLKAAWCSPTLV
jgi:hypothetical protein